MEGRQGHQGGHHRGDRRQGQVRSPVDHPARTWEVLSYFVLLPIFPNAIVVVVVVIVVVVDRVLLQLDPEVGEQVGEEGAEQGDERGDVEDEQSEVETAREKERSWEEGKVDRVPVQEGAGEVEGGGQVGERGDGEEGGGEEQLDDGTDGQLDHGHRQAEVGEVEAEQGGSVQQDVHLDRDTEAEEDAAKTPLVVEEHVDGGVEEQDGDGVVEQVDDC